MLAATRTHLRILAAIPTSTFGGRAIATSPLTDQQEGIKKSTWTTIKIFALPLFFFCSGTERVFSLRQKTKLAEKWERRLEMEALKGNEIDASSFGSLEFRKVKCKGVFDEKKSILVLENTGTASDPFAYEYSLLTPLILLPADSQSVCSSVLVNRGRVPRDWADYRKIEKFQSLEIVRDFPKKGHLSLVSQPQPVESVGVARNIMLKLREHFSPVSRPKPIEFVGVVRTGEYSEWLSIDVGSLIRAVGLDPEATLYVEQIEDASDGSNRSANTMATPYQDADMQGRLSMMRKEHLQMMMIWYCCCGGTLYSARWLMRKCL